MTRYTNIAPLPERIDLPAVGLGFAVVRLSR